jgi:CubicO group peptidase (beta-lactamase class C family)
VTGMPAQRGPGLAAMEHSARPGLALCVLQPDGRELHAHAGLASLELATPISEDTAFNIGSVAKQITACLLIQAARDQALALDCLVSALLPRFRLGGVTVADLIQHRGGVRDAESMLSLAGFRDLDHYTADDLLELAYRQRNRAVAPDEFLYSNTGYLLLAEILQNIHSASLNDIANQYFFIPLGMTRTRFQADPRDVIPGAASSYQRRPAGWTRTQRPVALPGPGTLWSTASDIGSWLTYLYRNCRPGDSLPFDTDFQYRPSDHPPYFYGPGLYADPRRGHLAVFHNGHEQGFSAATHLSRAGLRVICLSNHAGVAADHVASGALSQPVHQEADLRQLVEAALTTAAEIPTAPPCLAGKNDTSEHTPIGSYTCDEVPGILRLTRSGDQLYLWRRGTSQKLKPISPQSYAGEGYAIILPTTSIDAPQGFVLNLDRAPGLVYRIAHDGSGR